MSAGMTLRSPAALTAKRGSSCGGLLGGAELGPDVAGQVLGRRDQPARLRVVEHQGPEPLACVVLAGAEQPGDLGQAGFAVRVEADREGVGRGVRAEPRRPGRDDALAADGCLRGALADRVEFFQRVHGRRVRVDPETALRRPDPRHDLLARGRVGAPGAAHGEPVQRAVGAQVGVVAAVQLRAQLADPRRVLGGCRLRIEQRPHRVAQAGQRPELAGLAAGYLVGPFGAVEDPGERPVVQGPDIAVGLAGPGRGGLRPGSGSGCRGCPGESALPGVGRDRVQGVCQGRDGVAGRADYQVVGAVGAVDGAEFAEHPVGAVEEVFADRDLRAVKFCQACLLPGRRVGLAAGLSAAKDQQVGHHAGARGPLMGPAGQAHRPDEVGQRGDLPPGGRVARVHGVPGGQRHHQAARAGQVQRLDDEMVMQAVPGRVVPAVVQHGLAERDVADHQVVGLPPHPGCRRTTRPGSGPAGTARPRSPPSPGRARPR